ncbi:MAG TPA: DUF1326 domain-containing protein [Acidobacteriota bacterium]|jgi:hypothetical protein
MKIRYLSAALVLACAAAFAFSGSQMSSKTAASAPSIPDFEVEGIGFTMCQCPAYGCPCRSNGHPTHHTCEAADFAYIKHGHFGKIKLDGVKAVVVGDLLDSDQSRTYATAYFDKTTTPEQRKAYTEMLKFMFGKGMPVKMGSAKVVAIDFKQTDEPAKKVFTVTIPGILEEQAVLKLDKQGKPVSTVPAVDQWGNTIHYVDNVTFKYHDKELGKKWDLSGHQANVKFFHTTKGMYDRQELLAQFADMSGTWTAKQKEMIKKLGLKVE